MGTKTRTHGLCPTDHFGYGLERKVVCGDTDHGYGTDHFGYGLENKVVCGDTDHGYGTDHFGYGLERKVVCGDTDHGGHREAVVFISDKCSGIAHFIFFSDEHAFIRARLY